MLEDKLNSLRADGAQKVGNPCYEPSVWWRVSCNRLNIQIHGIRVKYHRSPIHVVPNSLLSFAFGGEQVKKYQKVWCTRPCSTCCHMQVRLQEMCFHKCNWELKQHSLVFIWTVVPNSLLGLVFGGQQVTKYQKVSCTFPWCTCCHMQVRLQEMCFHNGNWEVKQHSLVFIWTMVPNSLLGLVLDGQQVTKYQKVVCTFPWCTCCHMQVRLQEMCFHKCNWEVKQHSLVFIWTMVHNSLLGLVFGGQQVTKYQKVLCTFPWCTCCHKQVRLQEMCFHKCNWEVKQHSLVFIWTVVPNSLLGLVFGGQQVTKYQKVLCTFPWCTCCRMQVRLQEMCFHKCNWEVKQHSLVFIWTVVPNSLLGIVFGGQQVTKYQKVLCTFPWCTCCRMQVRLQEMCFHKCNWEVKQHSLVFIWTVVPNSLLGLVFGGQQVTKYQKVLCTFPWCTCCRMQVRLQEMCFHKCNWEVKQHSLVFIWTMVPNSLLGLVFGGQQVTKYQKVCALYLVYLLSYAGSLAGNVFSQMQLRSKAAFIGVHMDNGT